MASIKLFFVNGVTYFLSFCLWCFIIFTMIIRIMLKPSRARNTFTWKRRPYPPECMKNSELGVHSFIRLKNIRMHYVEAGENSGPLMLFLHGFPEFWYSWRFQLKEFKKCYRVVAIDMRGYGETDKPAGVHNYEINRLIGDITEVIKALGYDSCTLVAHDWGGALAWHLAAIHSDLVDKLIIMNAPHPGRFQKILETNWKQRIMSLFMLAFQMPLVPEFVFSLKDYKAIEDCFIGEKSGVKNKNNFNKEDIEAYKYNASIPGAMTAMLNYYRAAFSLQFNSIPKINVPTLFIWGDGDTALDISNIEGMEEYVENLNIRKVKGASHCVQQDEPEKVNNLMKEFLEMEEYVEII